MASPAGGGFFNGHQGRASMAKVAFIGLGVMGFPMAGHLRTRGKHELTVYNRTREKADKWVAAHGGARKSLRAAAEGADFVFLRVGTTTISAALRSAKGAGRHEAARSTSTTRPPPRPSRASPPRQRRSGARGFDAPVSGGQAGGKRAAYRDGRRRAGGTRLRRHRRLRQDGR
jgi:3-hydroxyisobutyrate dehydrogenase/2-hydroxy-3-oxopropionate reductase